MHDGVDDPGRRRPLLPWADFEHGGCSVSARPRHHVLAISKQLTGIELVVRQACSVALTYVTSLAIEAHGRARPKLRHGTAPVGC